MKPAPKVRWSAPLLGAVALLGCSSGNSINIGNTQTDGPQLSAFVGSWDGYAEAYTFMPDGSDRVRLTITANGQGTLQVGNAALLPAPTDPNSGYPGPGEPDPLTGPDPSLVGGFLYPLYSVGVQGTLIQAGLRPNDYYGAWCALQTSYYIQNGSTFTDGGEPVLLYGYSCLPGNGGGDGTFGCTVQIVSNDGGYSSQPVDCGKVALCSENICACAAASCSVSPVVPAGAAVSAYPAEFDGALDSTGRTLTATLALPGSTNGPTGDLRVIVVMTKQ